MSELCKEFVKLKQLSTYVESRKNDNDHVTPMGCCACDTGRGGHQDNTQFNRALQERNENTSRFRQQPSEQEKLLSENLKEIQENEVSRTKCAQEIHHLQALYRGASAVHNGQFHSTCVSMGGHLLEVGGCSRSGVGTRCIHHYTVTTVTVAYGRRLGSCVWLDGCAVQSVCPAMS